MIERVRRLGFADALGLAALGLTAAGLIVTGDGLVTAARATPGSSVMSWSDRLLLGLWSFRLEHTLWFTIGLLLLWLDHLVCLPRNRPVGWALIAGPVILAATMSGPALAATTGLAAGVLLLGSAAAGFHDLAALRPARPPRPARLHAKA